MARKDAVAVGVRLAANIVVAEKLVRDKRFKFEELAKMGDVGTETTAGGNVWCDVHSRVPRQNCRDVSARQCGQKRQGQSHAGG